MIVKVIQNNIHELDEKVKLRLSKTIRLDGPVDSLEMGKKYHVQAIGRWEEQLNFYIQTDEDYPNPSPYPAEFFQIIDSTFPSNWRIGLRTEVPYYQFIYSFPAWADEPMFYERLIDDDPDVVKIYLNNCLKDC